VRLSIGSVSLSSSQLCGRHTKQCCCRRRYSLLGDTAT
jgi:hypothetical protein